MDDGQKRLDSLRNLWNAPDISSYCHALCAALHYFMSHLQGRADGFGFWAAGGDYCSWAVGHDLFECLNIATVRRLYYIRAAFRSTSDSPRHQIRSVRDLRTVIGELARIDMQDNREVKADGVFHTFSHGAQTITLFGSADERRYCQSVSAQSDGVLGVGYLLTDRIIRTDDAALQDERYPPGQWLPC